MPWWGWIIVGVVGFFAFWYTVIAVLALTVFRSARKQIKKGW
jgi:hypothetical protein